MWFTAIGCCPHGFNRTVLSAQICGYLAYCLSASTVSIPIIVFGGGVMIVSLCTICCRVHPCSLLVATVKSFLCAVLSLLLALDVLVVGTPDCPPYQYGGCSNTASVFVRSVISVPLWTVTGFCLLQLFRDERRVASGDSDPSKVTKAVAPESRPSTTEKVMEPDWVGAEGVEVV